MNEPTEIVGSTAVPRPAATMVLLRAGAAAMEVLLMGTRLIAQRLAQETKVRLALLQAHLEKLASQGEPVKVKF